MVDRRILAAAVAIVVVVLAFVDATAGTATPATEPSQTSREAAIAPAQVNAATPVPPSAQPATSTSTTTTPPIEVIEPAGVVPSTVNEVADLVESRRPAIDAIPLPADHYHQDGAQEASDDVARHAGELVVAAWSWRFDDDATRQADTIGPLAADTVIDALVPTDSELARRRAEAEVAWVIIRGINAAGDQVTVVFDHHVVTSTTPETVTSRSVVVVVEDHQAIDVRL